MNTITLKTLPPHNTGTEVMPGEMLSHRVEGLIDALITFRNNGAVAIELEEDTDEGTDTIWCTGLFDTQLALDSAAIEYPGDTGKENNLWWLRVHV